MSRVDFHKSDHGLTSPNIPSSFSVFNKATRVLWGVCWLVFFRLSPSPFHFWRRFLLRLFGAELGSRCYIYPSVKIWLPSNLSIGDDTSVADGVYCYNVAPISIGSRSTVSYETFLCTASHDYSKRHMPLVKAPIVIADDVWVCAQAFVGPGVVVGKGAVCGARAVVTREVAPSTVVAGNPAVLIRQRRIDG
jgi:putative colanic acid biosynthesis acetyltransferase WcaF